MKHEILFMKYFYFRIQHSLCMFLTNKKIVFAEKRHRQRHTLITYNYILTDTSNSDTAAGAEFISSH